jgi:hypothetical protein
VIRVKPITEAEFTRMVLELARLHGWRVLHLRPARTLRGGWRTAVQGDGVGWPDIFAVRDGVILAAELKVGNGRPSPAQTAWLKALRAAGIAASVWRPSMWDVIEKALSR